MAWIEIPDKPRKSLVACSKGLNRWAERLCGDGSGWHVEVDDASNQAFNCRDDGSFKQRITNLETYYIARIDRICKSLGLNWFHQTDPRGTALYVSDEPMNDTNYSSLGILIG